MKKRPHFDLEVVETGKSIGLAEKLLKHKLLNSSVLDGGFHMLLDYDNSRDDVIKEKNIGELNH